MKFSGSSVQGSRAKGFQAFLLTYGVVLTAKEAFLMFAHTAKRYAQVKLWFIISLTLLGK